MSNRRSPSAGYAEDDLLIGVDPRREPPAVHDLDPDTWVRALRAALAARSHHSLLLAEQALSACPTDPELLLLAALTELANGRPERTHVLLKRYRKRYVPGREANLLTALALGQQQQFAKALTVLREDKLDTDRAAIACFVGDAVMHDWLLDNLREIRRKAYLLEKPRLPAKPPLKPVTRTQARLPRPAPVLPAPQSVGQLPKLEARFNMVFDLANLDAIATAELDPDPAAFYLRRELVRLSLFEGFDELLCLPALQGVEAHWYQVETVRKVLKQYRGRVLLADEVGLGKTVEAGMVLKEYILRGMAERILILTPASLVGQWRDEMAAKFRHRLRHHATTLCCAATPPRFWAQPRVIASIASGTPQGAGRRCCPACTTTWWWSMRRITCAISPVPATNW